MKYLEVLRIELNKERSELLWLLNVAELRYFFYFS